MKLNLKVIILAFLFFAAADLAFADSLTFVNGGNDIMGGVYVGPYNFTGTINGQTGTFQLVCDDFLHDIYSGEYWNVELSTFPTLSNVQFSGTTQYEEVAWLTQQMYQNLGNAQTVGDIQWAIWDIFDPGASSHDPYGTVSATDQTNITNLLNLASTKYLSGNYSDITVYTPVVGSQVPPADGHPQEFLGMSPEPGTLLLFGTGLCCLAALCRRFTV
jgi:hypothetical protein